MTDDPIVYYTKCVEDGHTFHLAIQAESFGVYNSILDDYLTENPKVKYQGYREMTPVEYKNYLRGY